MLLAMKRLALLIILLATPAFAQPAAWKTKLADTLPLLGHRNWILVVDSAYPLQSSPGVETIETDAGQIEVVRHVLEAVNHSIHVRPEVFIDAELPYVSEQDAPGASAYRNEIADILRPYKIQSLPHEKIIGSIDEAGKTFHILVLKTHMTVPYSSVFIRLNCRYWSDEAEARLRARMKTAQP